MVYYLGYFNVDYFSLDLGRGLKKHMVRISKLTDYGMVIMAFMALEPVRLFQAGEIAEQTAIPKPTVSKLLKLLVRNNLLISHRGANGGYHLSKCPEEITVLDLVSILEGPIAITECSLGHAHCPTEARCAIRTPWLHINRVITHALNTVTLSNLANKTRGIHVNLIPA